MIIDPYGKGRVGSEIQDITRSRADPVTLEQEETPFWFNAHDTANHLVFDHIAQFQSCAIRFELKNSILFLNNLLNLKSRAQVVQYCYGADFSSALLGGTCLQVLLTQDRDRQL